MGTVIGTALFAILPALVVGWIVALCVDPEAFQRGAKR